MSQQKERLETFAYASTRLACCSDAKLQNMLLETTKLHTGIGGSSALLQMDDVQIFVKKIPLTDLERLPENVMSTANICNLPLYYQYGVGSAGFNAWRELVAHIMTSNWVLSESSGNFPMLYHWRILPQTQAEPFNDVELKDLESQVEFWGGSSAVRKRLQDLHSSSACIVLFLEYFPTTLFTWLGTQLSVGGAKAELVVSFLDEELRQLCNFTSSRGFVHFDNHFKNILTGGRIALSDCGLALSQDFALSEIEIEFLNMHRTYDRCSTITNLVHFVIQTVFGSGDWEKRLQECVNGDNSKVEALGPSVADTIKRYAPIAQAMATFHHQLRSATHSTTYPHLKLEELMADIDDS
jgi:hypothetical protein